MPWTDAQRGALGRLASGETLKPGDPFYGQSPAWAKRALREGKRKVKAAKEAAVEGQRKALEGM